MPPLGEELLHVAIGQAEPQVPADRQVMTSGGKRTRRKRNDTPVEGESIEKTS
jgi:hypothetical protein